MRGYETWSFTSRSFAGAMALSVLLHLFWFFAITVVVALPKQGSPERPVLVSLGPVLDDTIFRTLVENKPELSQTFYRPLADLAPRIEPKELTAERYLSGDVVSLPFGLKRPSGALEGILSGPKAAPEWTTARPSADLEPRRVINRPPEPLPPPGPGGLPAPTTLECTVDASGTVQDVRVVASGGNPSADLSWARYLRGWQFAPLADLAGRTQTLRFELGFGPEADAERRA